MSNKKIVPTPAGIPGKQLEIHFPQTPPKKEEQKPKQTPRTPLDRQGTFKSFRL